MAGGKSQLARMHQDNSITVHVQVTDGSVHGDGEELYMPKDAHYEEIRREFHLEKPGDAWIIEYEERDGKPVQVRSEKPGSDFKVVNR